MSIFGNFGRIGGMNRDMPPMIKQEDSPEKKFEGIKDNFSKWLEDYLVNFYENAGSNRFEGFFDPVDSQINEYIGEDTERNKKRMELTIIFGKKLISFCNNIIFTQEYNEQHIKKFYGDLFEIFFSGSPNIFDNINGDFLQKIIMSSNIDETYKLRNIADTSGDMAYDLSFCSEDKMKDMIKDLEKMDASQKISALKQLSHSAMAAYGNGSWAEPAFERIVDSFEQMKKTETTPIVSFVLDFELKKINNFANNLNNFEGVDSLEDYEEENIFEEPSNIENNLRLESNNFFDRNNIILPLGSVYYSKVSRDYGSIVLPSNFIPFALVNMKEENREEPDFLLEEIKMIEALFEELSSIDGENINDQLRVDIGSALIYLSGKKLKDIDIYSAVDHDILIKINKKFEELNDLIEKIKKDKTLWDKYDEKIEEIVPLLKEIDLDKFKNILEKIVKKENNLPVIPIESYDGLTKNKELNPFGGDDFSHLVKILHTPEIRGYINKRLGIKIEELFLREQIYFLKFLSSSDEELFSRLEKILKDKGEKENMNFLRSFLSMSGNNTMGNKILTLGEKLPESSAHILFKTYGEMINASDEVGDILKDNLKEKATEDVINKAKESLLINAKDLLDKYSQKAKICEGQTCEDIGKELEERLSLAKKSIFAFSTACKVLVENGEFSFEDFKKAKLAYDQSPISEVMAEKIIKMHQENTKQYPDKLRDLWRGTLKDGLTNPNPNQLLVSASYEDEVVSAMRVIKREDGSWYGASFNVNPTIQGGRIGTELLKEVLKDLAKDKPFVADCYSKNPMLSTYLNKFGFKITKEIENYHNTGELVYEITIFPKDKKEN